MKAALPVLILERFNAWCLLVRDYVAAFYSNIVNHPFLNIHFQILPHTRPHLDPALHCTGTALEIIRLKTNLTCGHFQWPNSAASTAAFVTAPGAAAGYCSSMNTLQYVLYLLLQYCSTPPAGLLYLTKYPLCIWHLTCFQLSIKN